MASFPARQNSSRQMFCAREFPRSEASRERLFINARIDTYFIPTADPAARHEETVRRARKYVEAGADGIFVPGLEKLDEMTRIAQAVEQPLNVSAGFPGLPPVESLRDAGVRRVSLGCGPFQAALALARRIATETLNGRT